MKEWYQLIDVIVPSIVKIETPSGYGTGFLCARNEIGMTAIATAHHVVADADKWQQPIRIHNMTKGETIILQESDRVIIPDPRTDSAAIIIVKHATAAQLQLPEAPIDLITVGRHMRVGVEVAWLGYPAIDPDTLCFFAGKISAWNKSKAAYLIDGVAINGVSGGPVLRRSDESVAIIGSISAYRRLPSGITPGLSVAQDVAHFQQIVSTFKTVDEAAHKKQEEEAAKAANQSAEPEPPT
jgi:S1-C subfamily serine protease